MTEGSPDEPRIQADAVMAPMAINGGMESADLDHALNPYLSKITEQDIFSGVVLIAREGRTVFQKAYGFADRAHGIPNTTHTRFNLGSINKTFTQQAIDQLVAEGNLAYSDMLGTLFPDYPQEISRAATVEQLLNNTAGLTDLFGPEFSQAAKDQFRSNADFFRFASTLPPLFPPGSDQHHCNGCYIALGAIVELVSGVPYEEYVTEHVYEPAGMTDTGFPHADGIEPNLALGYTRRPANGALRSNIFLHGAAGSAAGGGFSTSEDLLAYVRARRDGRLPGGPIRGVIVGGQAGVNTTVQANDVWTVIVLTNLDPPIAQQVGTAIMEALTGRS
ncbi:MAG: serine hydrolase domain-containing protein [Vicinamibacteraceae bacterium]